LYDGFPIFCGEHHTEHVRHAGASHKFSIKWSFMVVRGHCSSPSTNISRLIHLVHLFRARIDLTIITRWGKRENVGILKQRIEVTTHKLVIKILQSSVATQTMLGGLTICHPVANFL